jgi:hypothetical protein
MSKNKIWSPCFNLKHSSSDYIERKRKQTLYVQSQTKYSYTNNETTYYKFPDYWMRTNIQDGKRLCPCENENQDEQPLCGPCPADTIEGTPEEIIAQMQLKQYE